MIDSCIEPSHPSSFKSPHILNICGKPCILSIGGNVNCYLLLLLFLTRKCYMCHNLSLPLYSKMYYFFIFDIIYTWKPQLLLYSNPKTHFWTEFRVWINFLIVIHEKNGVLLNATGVWGSCHSPPPSRSRAESCWGTRKIQFLLLKRSQTGLSFIHFSCKIYCCLRNFCISLSSWNNYNPCFFSFLKNICL